MRVKPTGQTQVPDIMTLFFILNFGYDNNVIFPLFFGTCRTGSIKLKPVKQERINSNHITYEDYQKLIEVCLNQRDRAMIAFLLDSRVRRGELLKLNTMMSSLKMMV